jgi:hypothetical protein
MVKLRGMQTGVRVDATLRNMLAGYWSGLLCGISLSREK